MIYNRKICVVKTSRHRVVRQSYFIFKHRNRGHLHLSENLMLVFKFYIDIFIRNYRNPRSLNMIAERSSVISQYLKFKSLSGATFACLLKKEFSSTTAELFVSQLHHFLWTPTQLMDCVWRSCQLKTTVDVMSFTNSLRLSWWRFIQ